MNEKEYIKNRCSKCINRNNIKDLCNIVKTMDGNYRCSNEKVLIELNEYIKTCTGAIRKIVSFEVIDEEYQIYGIDKVCLLPIYTEDDSKLEALDSIGDDQILKHNKKITELIEEGDIVIYSITSQITKTGVVRKYTYRANKSYLGVDGYALNQIKIKKIITKNELEKVGYELNESI